MNDLSSMPGGGRGRYVVRDVTRLGVRLVECVWVPAAARRAPCCSP